MNIIELKEYAGSVGKDLKERYNIADKEKFLLAVTTKLSEETGELAEAVLKNINYQSDWKLDNTKIDAKEEIGDVILCTSIIAAELSIDVEEALAGAKEKFERRKHADSHTE